MRLSAIKAQNVPPIRAFEVSGLSDVIVLAGPNGVGKSRLISQILQHFQNPAGKDISLIVEATDSSEEKVWGKKTLDTANSQDGTLLQQLLQRQTQRCRNFRSNVLYFESDRSIQHVNPFPFSWDIKDPWDEQINWNVAFGGLRNRFQDTRFSQNGFTV
ncbi:MAG: hypothetical protein WBS33_07345 [Verrucomicrobiia bacterium]